MPDEIWLAVVTGVLGLITASVVAVVGGAIKARGGVDEGLRAKRLDVYPALWLDTAVLSRWPRVAVTRADLEALHRAMRTWYYSIGGLFLSEWSRARYGDVQELIAAMLARAGEGDPAAALGPAGYDDLMTTCSALRTALAQDLETRRRRSALESWRRGRWHASAGVAAKERIARAAGGPSAFA